MFSLPWFGEFGEHRKMQDVAKKRDLKENVRNIGWGRRSKFDRVMRLRGH
jgi:hypothetical protein